MTDERTKPRVTCVAIHSWPYGDDKWIEVVFEGENVDVLNVVYGGPARYECIARAAIDVGACLNAYGGSAAGLGGSCVEHDEIKGEPRLGGLDETCGSLDEDGLEIDFGGACPVQGYGTVDDHLCYYRSRGTAWQFAVWEIGVTQDMIEAEDLPPIFEHVEDRYAYPDAGWLHGDESIDNIRKAVTVFRTTSKD